MNKIKLLQFFVATLFVVSFTSCDKDEDTEPSQQALLTAEEWTGASVYVDGQNYTQYFSDSLGFDIVEMSYRFDDNGEYRYTYGQTVLGTWEFSGDEQSAIILDKGKSFEDEVTIINLTSDELYLEVNWWYDSSTGESIPVELRFSRE